MNPGGKINVVGIREGEKLHEVMITSDDSRAHMTMEIIISFIQITFGGRKIITLKKVAL